MSNLIEVATQGSIAELTLRRPAKLNALSLALVDEFSSALRGVQQDSSLRGLVIRGSDGAFSVGADLTEALERSAIPAVVDYLQRLGHLTDLLEKCTLPSVAAVDGLCFTGGLEIALACDRILATPRSQFAVTSTRIGGLPAMGATQRLPRLIGPMAAKDLLLTGRQVDAEEALALGLVAGLSDDVASDAMQWLEQCAAGAPLSLALIKRAVTGGAGLPTASALELEQLLATVAFLSHDRHEGMRAILEKRSPEFRGE